MLGNIRYFSQKLSHLTFCPNGIHLVMVKSNLTDSEAKAHRSRVTCPVSDSFKLKINFSSYLLVEIKYQVYNYVVSFKAIL